MTVMETTVSQFNVTGDFFEIGTELISDEMPKSFSFRGKDNYTVKASVSFLKVKENRYVATFVVEKTHHIGEE